MRGPCVKSDNKICHKFLWRVWKNSITCTIFHALLSTWYISLPNINPFDLYFQLSRISILQSLYSSIIRVVYFALSRLDKWLGEGSILYWLWKEGGGMQFKNRIKKYELGCTMGREFRQSQVRHWLGNKTELCHENIGQAKSFPLQDCWSCKRVEYVDSPRVTGKRKHYFVFFIFL